MGRESLGSKRAAGKARRVQHPRSGLTRLPTGREAFGDCLSKVHDTLQGHGASRLLKKEADRLSDILSNELTKKGWGGWRLVEKMPWPWGVSRHHAGDRLGAEGWIDAHGHVPLDIPEAADWLREFGISAAFNICVAHEDLGSLETQRAWYRKLSAANPERWAWATSFSLENFGTEGWAERAIAGIAEDYAGPGRASGCKVWKNIGMELRDPQSGAWVFVDDARFDAVFQWLEHQRRPLLMHIAEPLQAWRDLDPRDPHYSYFREEPRWHWFGRDDVPSYDRLLASRDEVVARYPNLPVIGLHFGSQEHDLAAVAERLDQWPNYYVDTAGRIGDLLVHAESDRDRLIHFFETYQDRILWGVDFVLTRPVSEYSPQEKTDLHNAMAARYQLERRFFSTREKFTVEGKTVRGLGLGRGVLDKLIRGNARNLYWGDDPGK